VTSFLGRQSSRLPTGHMPRARSCRPYGARPCPRQKRTFTPSVAMHIHTAWLAASRAVSGTAMQLTSAIHTKVTSSLIMRLSCGDTLKSIRGAAPVWVRGTSSVSAGHP
jgi:hypothetical protein